MLTIYATLTTLVGQHRLEVVDADLAASVLPHRMMYAAPRLIKWLDEDLEKVPRQWDEELEPVEQVDQLLQRYAEGRPLSYGDDFKCLNPIGNSMWELKTRDVRIFGWFAGMDLFIGSAANDASVIKDLNLYIPYAEEALRLRAELGLPFLAGDDPDVVLSTKN